MIEKMKMILDEKNKSKITEIFLHETLFLRKLILQIRKLLTRNLQNIFCNKKIKVFDNLKSTIKIRALILK